MCGYSVFLSQKQQEDKTLITKKKKQLLYPSHRIHNGLQKQAKNFLSAQAFAPWIKP